MRYLFLCMLACACVDAPETGHVDASVSDEDAGVDVLAEELSTAACWSGTRTLQSVQVSTKVQFCQGLEETGCYKTWAVPYGAHGGCNSYPRANVELLSSWGWYPLQWETTCQPTAAASKTQLLNNLTCKRVRYTALGGSADNSTKRVVP